MKKGYLFLTLFLISLLLIKPYLTKESKITEGIIKEVEYNSNKIKITLESNKNYNLYSKDIIILKNKDKIRIETINSSEKEEVITKLWK